MTSHNITECDRCHTWCDAGKNTKNLTCQKGWSLLQLETFANIGANEVREMDLCDKCTKSLEEWAERND